LRVGGRDDAQIAAMLLASLSCVFSLRVEASWVPLNHCEKRSQKHSFECGSRLYRKDHYSKFVRSTKDQAHVRSRNRGTKRKRQRSEPSMFLCETAMMSMLVFFLEREKTVQRMRWEHGAGYGLMLTTAP